jgi:beta-glucosidase
MTATFRSPRLRLVTALAAGAAACFAFAPGSFAQPASTSAERPLYKDRSQPTARRVEDLLARMTLEEKVAQLVTIWEHKGKIQTPGGDFSPEKASAEFPHGLGQLARPSDKRGVTQTNAAAGATAGAVNRPRNRRLHQRRPALVDGTHPLGYPHADARGSAARLRRPRRHQFPAIDRAC